MLSKSAAEIPNGIQNANAFDANNAITESLTSSFGAKQADANDSEELFLGDEEVVDAPDSFITQQTSTQDDSLELSSQAHAFSEEQLHATTDLPPLASSVPPVIEAQESDLRAEISPATQAQVDSVKAEKHDLNLTANSSLAVTSADSSFNNDTMDSDPSIPVVDVASGTSQPSSFDQQPLHPQSVANIDLDQTSQPDLAISTGSPLLDVNMTDAPASPTKAARAREEDTDEEPSAKRTKTEDEPSTSEFAVPAHPASVITVSPAIATPTAPAPGDDAAPTQYQQKEILKVIRQQKSTVNGKNFRDSVSSLWPTISEQYLEKIKNPIDLLVIETRLKEGGYATLGDLKKDLNLLYDNCVIFNGPVHEVTRAAETVRSNIISKIPGPEPVKKEKPKPTPATSPPPRAAARRKSVHTRPEPTLATSPTGPAPQTFALNPSGTPLIRRDSTKNDTGRPKREIHPPKNKDLIYNSRPKKKFEKELKFCDEILTELRKPKYGHINQPFLNPVDPVALGIPDYFRVIKSPMDLSTVADKLTNGEITSAKDFEADVRLIFKNCYKFNPEGSAVNLMGKQLEEVFDREWLKKSQWIADHPSPNATSPYSGSESDADESEEEAEQPAVPNSTALLQARLIEEQNKLIGILATKDADPTLEQLQRDFIKIVEAQIEQLNKAAAKTAKAKPKAKAPKKTAPAAKKKAEPAKKAYRVKNIGLAEKEQISEGIGRLEGRDMEAAIAILKRDMPTLNVSLQFPSTLLQQKLTRYRLMEKRSLTSSSSPTRPCRSYTISSSRKFPVSFQPSKNLSASPSSLGQRRTSP